MVQVDLLEYLINILDGFKAPVLTEPSLKGSLTQYKGGFSLFALVSLMISRIASKN